MWLFREQLVSQKVRLPNAHKQLSTPVTPRLGGKQCVLSSFRLHERLPQRKAMVEEIPGGLPVRHGCVQVSVHTHLSGLHTEDREAEKTVKTEGYIQ